MKVPSSFSMGFSSTLSLCLFCFLFFFFIGLSSCSSGSSLIIVSKSSTVASKLVGAPCSIILTEPTLGVSSFIGFLSGSPISEVIETPSILVLPVGEPNGWSKSFSSSLIRLSGMYRNSFNPVISRAESVLFANTFSTQSLMKFWMLSKACFPMGL